ncbi:MAG: glutamate racemase [Nitrospirae bacterium GWB2_47_37]|nr:MAG: glutamate racemase [Nitrospirae bacterium GWB2_47_37]HAK88873.1 glutamate racemase [Nitrospiraceae bacterium]
MNDNPIGIFDSGVGGLTVLKEIAELLPAENILYLGDTARVPYGIRSPETVIRYSFECTEFLLRKNIKLLVVACNTVSAISLQKIREAVSIPVIGVIDPGAAAAVNVTKNKRIGIIGTEATIKSSSYVKAVKALNREIEVYGLACPLFVPLVEEGWTEGTIARLIAEKYLKDMTDKETDTIVLGCTHYPLLKGVIQEVMRDVRLVDSAIETAKAVKDALWEKRMNREAGAASERKFYVTDSTEKFVSVGERFLQQEIKNIEKIAL